MNIWCGITGHLLIGLSELEDSLTGELYRRFLQVEMPQLLEDVPMEVRREMWVQQDGAPPHFGGTAFLNRQFPDRWISQRRSGYLVCKVTISNTHGLLSLGSHESLVYVKRSNGVAELINQKMDASDQIRNSQEMVIRAVTSIVGRAQMCVDNQSGHFEKACRMYLK